MRFFLTEGGRIYSNLPQASNEFVTALLGGNHVGFILPTSYKYKKKLLNTNNTLLIIYWIRELHCFKNRVG
jgi:hypothetical protein